MSMEIPKVGKQSGSLRLKKPAKYVRVTGGKVASLASKSHLLVQEMGPQITPTVQDVQIAGLAIGAVGLIGTGYEMYSNIKDIHESKGRVKVIPSLLLVSNFGSIAGYCGQLTGLISSKLHLAGAALSHASLAITALGVAALGLQLVKLAVDVVELRTLCKMSKMFEKDMSTEVKGVRSIFRVFTKEQKQRIDNLKLMKADQLKETMKKRFSYLKKMKALAIAIGVIAIIGVVLASFSPPPFCFIGWAVIGVTLVAAIARAVHMGVEKRRFDRELAHLNGEFPRKPLEPRPLPGIYGGNVPYSP